MQSGVLVNIAYLIAASLFILGLKGLTHPRNAVRGNIMSAAGMLLAVLVTLIARNILSYEFIIAGLVIGGLLGTILALRIKMTAMPQLVGLFNGFGGLASALVAGAVLFEIIKTAGSGEGGLQVLIATTLSGLIGAVTFFGSLIAFGKLQRIVTEKPVRYPGEQIVKLLVLAGALTLGVLLIGNPDQINLYWYLVAAGSLLGILLVVPIGGADMPIVIALLNSYSGLAAAATGFVLSNMVLIVAGSLVGASGFILTSIMTKAMNRSLANVLFGGIGAVQKTESSTDDIYEGKIQQTSAEEVAMILKSAQRIVFVPGYGMAVARAQTPVRILTELLEAEGKEVEFGIHPVAGRMPGHMNVLLAEENISYDKLKEMDQINQSFSQTDVTIVLGANDVVNPKAREASGTPISGMPILNVDQSKTVVVIKRSLSPGFSGIANPLFAAENTLMFFGDGKTSMEKLVSAYKEEP